MIRLYSNILPNINNTTHYIFNSFDNYKNSLASNLVASITEDNYRLNANVLKVALDNTITLSNFDTITYIIEERENYKRCYHVNTSIVQSGYVIYDCSVDLWASYIADADFDKIQVTQCNRNIGNGLYLPVQACRYGATGLLEENIGVSYTNLAVLFLVNQKSTNLGDKYSTQDLFYIPVNTLLNLSAFSSLPRNQTTVANIIGNIDRALYLSQSATDCFIEKIYIVPTNWVLSDDNTATFQTNYPSPSTTIGASAFHVSPSKGQTVIPVTNAKIESLLNYDLFFGCYGNSAKIYKQTNSNYLYAKYDIDVNKLTVAVGQNAYMRDITNCFELSFTASSGTTQMDIANKISNLASNVLSIGGAIATGNAAGVISGGTSLVKTINTDNNTAYHSTGNSIATWGYQLNNAEVYPFKLYKYPSLSNEEKIARLHGASFNDYVPNFATLFSYSLIGTTGTTDTYIRANVSINNIPLAPTEYITNELAKGIYCKKV